MTTFDSKPSSLAVLAAEARLYAPRVFTIYGLANNPESPDILGWGMDFDHLGKTIFVEPHSSGVHQASSPEDLRLLFNLSGYTRLEWLDEAQT